MFGDFFIKNLDIVFFIYGVAFLILGIIIFLQLRVTEKSKYRLLNILWLLAFFGITHSIHEFMDMFILIKGELIFLKILGDIFLFISYLCLFLFGYQLINVSRREKRSIWLPSIIFILFFGLQTFLEGNILWNNLLDILTRYLLGFPGGILSAVGFLLYYQSESEKLSRIKVKKYFIFIALLFGIYGTLGGLVVPRENFLLASVINDTSFFAWFGIPVQFFRAISAIGIAFSILHVVDIFNIEETAEHKHVDEALRESEERYRKLVEFSPDTIAIHSGGKIVFINTAGAKLLGAAEAGKVIGKKIIDIVHPDYQETVKERIRQMKEEGKNVSTTEEKFIKLDGSVIDVEMTVMPFTYQGKPSIQVTVRDITDHKRAEEALKQSEEKYRTLIDNIQDGVFILQDGKIQFANEAFARMCGYTVEEVIGKDFRELVAPEDLEMVVDRYFRRQAGEDVPREYEFHGIQRDGTRTTVNMNVGLITYRGRVASMGTVKDVTERKRAIEQIQEQASLLDKAHDAIIVRDLEHRITYWNLGAQRLYGWTAEDAIGKNANELLYTEEPLSLIEANKNVIERDEWKGELRQVTKEGKEIIVESRWTLVRDSNGNPKSILIINTDITEKKTLEAKFLRAQRLESIGTLAGGIAHDLNNVMTPMMLSVEMLKEKFKDEQSQKLLTILEKTSQRGANLIKQVMSFARGVEGEHKSLQIRHLISEIGKVIKETFPKSIEIRTDIQKDLFTISGDATQLHQVIMNLCVNARDAMPDGGILSIVAENFLIDENYVRMHTEAKVGQYVVIGVSDTGTGIPSEILDRIFEPFFTTKEPGKGTGLGLSTSLGIVKSHGGFIDVQSEVGKGTAFRVYLPAIKTEIQKADKQQTELPIGNGELVLVAEDEGSIREITCSTLEAYGYKVLSAEDGVEAVVLYTQNKDKIDIVLMNMMMPVMNGETSIHTIHRINPEIKIIAVSGLEEQDKLEKISDYTNAFLPKPYTTEKLLKTIHEVLSAK